jgi:hypothetical protein
LTHILEIQEDHLNHLGIEVATTSFFYLKSLKFVAASQDDKVLYTIQQIQVKSLSPNVLRGSTIIKLFQRLQQTASKGNMELLISALSDLFQIIVSCFYKSASRELNIFLHIPMVKQLELLKFFQFFKFLLTQNHVHNMTMMPIVEQDLLANGQDHLLDLLSQSDLNSCTKYSATFMQGL